MNKKVFEFAQAINSLSFRLLGLLNDQELDAARRQGVIHLMSPQRKKPKEGCILERKDGRFEGRYMAEGRQKSVYGKTYADCLKRLTTAIAARDGTQAIVTTVHSWAQTFLDIYKKPRIMPETYSIYAGLLKNHIFTQLPDMQLSAVRPLHLQKVLNAVSGRTSEDVYNFLSGMFRQAYNEQLISFNPMLGVCRVRHKREKGVALTLDEQQAFLAKDDGSMLFKYYLFCLYSGCRRQEALTVGPADIDETKGRLHIPGTKTDGSNRYIPLFAPLKALLPCLPFPFKADYVTRHFHDYCAGHRLHDLRHTFATRCLESGVSMKVLQGWLGHSSIDTTADIYLDVFAELGASEAEKVAKAFKIDTKIDTKNNEN